MEDIMEELLEKKLLRHYHILKALLYKGWITTSSIAKETGISERTLQKDIGEINSYITPAIIETSLKSGIHLEYAANLNTFYIFSALYYQSANFLILEELLLHRYHSLHELAERLFLSDSTLARKITAINHCVRKNHFKIDTNQLKVVGDEKQIRNFYYCYFVEKFGVIDSFIPPLELSLLNELIGEFFNHFADLKNPERAGFSYLNKMRIRLFVTIKRLQQNELIVISEVPDTFTLSPLVAKKLATFYHLTINNQTIYQLFYRFFNDFYAWSTTDLTAKINQQKECQQIYQALATIIETVEHSEHVHLENKSKVKLALYNELIQNYGPTKILYQLSDEFFIHLNHYYESFIFRVKVVLKVNLTKNNLPIYFDDTVLNHLLFKLVIAWQDLSLQLTALEPKITAALFFNTSFDHTMFLQQEILYYLKDRVEITLLTAKSIAEIDQSKQQFDMIITNLSSLTLKDCPIISIHATPTPDDYKAILDQYTEIINKKVIRDLSLTPKHGR
jgi:AraC-like DNA-binding protein